MVTPIIFHIFIFKFSYPRFFTFLPCWFCLTMFQPLFFGSNNKKIFHTSSMHFLVFNYAPSIHYLICYPFSTPRPRSPPFLPHTRLLSIPCFPASPLFFFFPPPIIRYPTISILFLFHTFCPFCLTLF